MATFTGNLTTTADTFYKSGGGSWISGPGTMSAGLGKISGTRFQSVIVPKNAVIASATVSFSGYLVNSGTSFGGVSGEASDNAPAWNDPFPAPDNVGLGSAFIDVPSASPWDVTDIIQEIVTRAGWASGNALAFVATDSITGADGTVSWTNDTAQTVLTIVYNVGGGAVGQSKKISQGFYSAANWPYVFGRGRQPYSTRLLSPPLLVPVVNDPPIQNAGETPAQQAVILAAAQPNPWGYNFSGGPQPYAPRRLPADIINYIPPFVPPDNPPLQYPQRSRPGFFDEIQQWQPDIWPPFFVGGRQAYAPRQLPPVITDLPPPPIDAPPLQAAGRTVQARAIIQFWQPDPWVYVFAGGRQPYTEGALTQPDTPINDPPFRHRGKSSQVMTAIWQWQPDIWPKMYFGGRGLYARKTLPPESIAIPPNIGQKIVRNVVVRQRLVFGPGKEPGLR
jgi:hypothetical protein